VGPVREAQRDCPYSASERNRWQRFRVNSGAVLPERAIALVAPHCDIAERLPLIPPSASVRGLYFKNVEAQVEKKGRLGAYKEYFPTDRFSSLTFYPVSEFLVRLACAGAIVASPARVHDGMFLITKGNAEAFVQSLLGRLMLRMLARDPVRLIEQGAAARRQSVSYGHWETRRLGDRAVEVVYTDEYWWIESAIAGAAQGTFEASGVTAEVETKMIDRFNGSTIVRW
jgi:uncharacterized protein (TIGR02265 family)